MEAGETERMTMDTYQESMDRFHNMLKAAMQNEALLMVIDTLVKMAELMVDQAEKERGVEILTIALNYPMRQGTRLRAEALYDDLEAELRPRVIVDARQLAEDMTLDDLLAAILRRD